MQKIIGSIVVVLACTGIGYEKSREMQLHVKELEELKRVFTLLRSEIYYTKAPFSVVFAKIGNKVEGLYGTWLQELSYDLEQRDRGMFQEIWEQSIHKHFDRNTLKKDERKGLCALGASLGYLETIDLYLEQLNLTIQTTREETASKKKLYQSMGVMGGIFLVIVLL